VERFLIEKLVPKENIQTPEASSINVNLPW